MWGSDEAQRVFKLCLSNNKKDKQDWRDVQHQERGSHGEIGLLRVAIRL